MELSHYLRQSIEAINQKLDSYPVLLKGTIGNLNIRIVRNDICRAIRRLVEFNYFLDYYHFDIGESMPVRGDSVEKFISLKK